MQSQEGIFSYYFYHNNCSNTREKRFIDSPRSKESNNPSPSLNIGLKAIRELTMPILLILSFFVLYFHVHITANVPSRSI